MNGMDIKLLGSLVTAFLVVAILGPLFIPMLHKLKFNRLVISELQACFVSIG